METNFVLITPAYNEEAFIGAAIESVVAQPIRPTRWIIADDGSTDKTGKIIKEYAAKHDFIVYCPLKREMIKTYYARRVHVLLAAIEMVRTLDFDFLAVLDADLTLPSTYYEGILKEFDRNPSLGIASGVYVNLVEGRLQKVVRDNSSTPGGLLVFRRVCYESIGGYTALPYGGEDTLVNIQARMGGWQTRSFPEYTAIHYRPTGMRGGRYVFGNKVVQGLADYHLGTHPLFMLLKCGRRMFIERPYGLASMGRLVGFCQGYWRREPRSIPDEVMRYVRKEQIRRLYYCDHSDWQVK